MTTVATEAADDSGGTTVNDKDAARIQSMFGDVAPRYDLLNHLLSASLDRVWRRRAARALSAGTSQPVIDICCGTGDQALALSRKEHRVVAADFCIPMLALASPKYRQARGHAPAGLAADALALPFAGSSFGGATVSFGLRNVADLDQALGEIRRVLRPGGELIVLEFAMPTRRLVGSLYRFYFRYVLPLIGRAISASGSAYTYLPQSVPNFPQREEFLEHMRAVGFEDTSSTDLSGGTVCLYRGRSS